MSSQPIEEIRKQFHHEWLLIAVDEMDEATTTPITGHLLFHDKNRDAIYDHLVQTRVELPLVTYSEDWPEDVAICTRLCVPFFGESSIETHSTE